MFKDVIGLAAVKHHLKQMVEHNRLSHALLFLGKEGSGALPMALALAQYLVCEKAGGRKPGAGEADLFGGAIEILPYPADSCGQCQACIKAAAMVHPDIHYSFPIYPKKPGDKPTSNDFLTSFREFVANNPYGNSYDWLQFTGAENKQGNIPAAECENIIHKLSLKSFEAGYKILIMWMPELLRNEGNKLLKLIEEPPPDTLFILVAEDESDILPTIISRTQLVKINLPQPAEVEKTLLDRFGANPLQAKQAAILSEGNVREALQAIGQEDENWDVMLRDWLNAMLRTGPAEQVKWIEKMAKAGREKQKQFLKFFIHVLELSIRVQAMGVDNLAHFNLDGNKGVNDLALRINKICDINQLEAIINELDKAIYHIERNANGKLLFHALTIRFYHIISNRSVIEVN